METLSTAELVLEPLTVAHAQAMYAVLREPALYQYLDHGPPPSAEHVRGVYERLEQRTSPDGRQGWLNWVVCLGSSGAPMGFVQATLVSPRTAWVAYLLGSAYWGHGHAHAATAAMLEHLTSRHAITEFLATVEKENLRSVALLARLRFEQASVEKAATHDLSATELLFRLLRSESDSGCVTR